ncbi:hypothetical protein GCM10011367_17030 [Marinicauda pacifica]|uniref:Lipoprotein n=1 Tax=Marinicauda pacifica TaxID=1133559 RepID=A0A4V3RZ76_9PROT|nr:MULTISPECIES: hypothetical protein [Marinicauda]TGY93109.1 hypothetical protein E5162_08585 [Marinicauda pacifica]GGE42920.1 hypothetical protein GCM10011367_17030 [Marinicauda pacifica]
MPTKSFAQFLLIGASCAVLAACSGSSVNSPGEENQVPPPPTGGGGGGGAQTLNLIPSAGCPSGTTSSTEAVSFSGGSADVTACRLTGNLTSDVTVPANATVFLSGAVFVGSDAGATGGNNGPTLTLEPGATVMGQSGGDYIVVPRGSSIDAQGTATNPVVMTSAQDIVEQRLGTPREFFSGVRGEWGGLVLNGRAPINACIDGTAAGGTADCQKSGEGSSGLFGGGDPADSSGTLSYVQVKYAGFRVNNTDELNGIAFQGTGSGTTAEFIQVHNNTDDGIEMFGGATNLRNVVLTGIGDDSLDYTDGWTGNVQFALVVHAPDDSDQGFEFDNNGDDNDALPRSNPTISNFTLIGQRASSASDAGMLLREGTAGTLANGIVVDFNETCLDIDQAATFDQAAAGNLSLQSTLFDCPTNFGDEAGDPAANTPSAFFAKDPNNVATTNTLADTYFPGPAELAVTPVDPTTLGSFFTAADYIGAFSPSESPSSSWAAGWTFGLFADPDCPTNTTATGELINGQEVCRLTGTLLDDTTLTGGFAYELVGAVFVGRDAGADPASPTANAREVNLTIEPGATLFGSSGGDYLVVTRGSSLNSNGTANRPVVMTSRADIEGTQPNPLTARGEWGGLVINGRAPINACIDGTATGGSVNCEKSGEGSSGLFGGATADDDSGSLSYTRVQYAGFRVNNTDELNGIAFQGVGSGTDVNFIQVHNNSDDGVEFFGGTVNAKHIVLTGNADDSMDYTDGWTGKVQYVIVQHAVDDADQAFEFDNNGDANDALPRSNPTISNFTLIGQRASSSSDYGMLLREGTAGRLMNGIVVDFNDACLDIDQSATFNQAAAGNLGLESTFFDCPTNFEDESGDPAATQPSALFAAGANNVTGTTSLEGFSFITDMSANNASGVVPAPAGPEAGVTAIDPSTVDAFFDSVTYIGAVENAADTWYQGWTLQQQ